MCVYTDREIKQKRQNINNYSIQMLNVLFFFCKFEIFKIKSWGGDDKKNNLQILD